MGSYTGRFEVDGRSRRFRLLLYAARPDRLHGEVLSALGSTELILDGGDGELAVSLVRDGVAYVGRATPEALERILGIALTLEQLVGALLDGRLDGPACELIHEPGPGDLPREVEFRSDRARLVLALRRPYPLSFMAEGLATGHPPEGMLVRPLDELASVEPDRVLIAGPEGE